MELKNSITGQVVEAIGCWPQLNNVVVFLTGQAHKLLDWDSPIEFDSTPYTLYDDVANMSFDHYELPAPWAVI